MHTKISDGDPKSKASLDSIFLIVALRWITSDPGVFSGYEIFRMLIMKQQKADDLKIQEHWDRRSAM